MISPQRLYEGKTTPSPIRKPGQNVEGNRNMQDPYNSVLAPFESQVEPSFENGALRQNNNANTNNRGNENYGNILNNYRGNNFPSRNRNRDGDKRVKDLMNLNEALKKANFNLEKDTQKLAQNLENMLNHNNKLKGELNEKNKKMHVLENEVNGRQRELVNLRNDLNEKNRYLQNGKHDFENLKRQNQSFANENNILKNKFDDYAKEMGENHAELSAKVNQLGQQNANLSEKINFYEVKEKPDILNRLRNQETEIKKFIESSKLMENQVKGQKDKIEILEGRIKQKDSRIKELEIGSKFKRGLETSENQKLLNMIEKSQKKEIEYQNRISHLENALSNQGNEMDKIVHELNKERRKNLDQEKKVPVYKFQGLVDENKKLKEDNIRLKTKPSEEWKHASQLLSIKNENQTLRKKLALYQTKDNEGPLDLRNPNLTPSEYMKVFENLKRRAKEAEYENKKLRKSKKEEVEMMKKMHDDLIDKLEKDNSDLKKDKMELVRKVNNLVDTNFKLKRALQNKQPGKENQWQDIYNKEVEHRRELERANERLELENGDLRKQLRGLNKKVQKIGGGVDQEDKLRQNYESKVKKYQDNCLTLIQKCKDLQEEKKALSLYIMKIDKERGKNVQDTLPKEFKEYINKEEIQEKQENEQKELNEQNINPNATNEIKEMLKELILLQAQNKGGVNQNPGEVVKKVVVQNHAQVQNYQTNPARVYKAQPQSTYKPREVIHARRIGSAPREIARPRSSSRGRIAYGGGHAIGRRNPYQYGTYGNDYEFARARDTVNLDVDPNMDAKDLVRSAYNRVVSDIGRY